MAPITSVEMMATIIFREIKAATRSVVIEVTIASRVITATIHYAVMMEKMTYAVGAITTLFEVVEATTLLMEAKAMMNSSVMPITILLSGAQEMIS